MILASWREGEKVGDQRIKYVEVGNMPGIDDLSADEAEDVFIMFQADVKNNNYTSEEQFANAFLTCINVVRMLRNTLIN